MNVWLLSRIAGARVQTDMAETVHYDAVDQVDGLASTSQVDLGPVVLAGGAVDVTRGRGGLDSSVPEIQLWLTYTSKDNALWWNNKWQTLKGQFILIKNTRQWHHIITAKTRQRFYVLHCPASVIRASARYSVVKS